VRLGRIIMKRVVRGGEIVPRQILPLSMSFDHRIVDGANGALFMNALITFPANPLSLLLVS
jgi:pyruvate dehydrogenase E2 component (dihydrolipoamide acetyltransferase)